MFTIGAALDEIIGWFLAGLVLAAIVRPTKNPEDRSPGLRGMVDGHWEGIRVHEPEAGSANRDPASRSARPHGLFGRRVVVDDLPAFGKLAEDQREEPARAWFRRASSAASLRAPSIASGPSGSISTRRKREPAHGLALGLIPAAIAVAHRLPAIVRADRPTETPPWANSSSRRGSRPDLPCSSRPPGDRGHHARHGRRRLIGRLHTPVGPTSCRRLVSASIKNVPPPRS